VSRNAYLIVSDLHLTDVQDNADGWKAYKSSRYLFDKDFRELVRRFVDGAEPGTPLTLILNGDTFDFDLITAIPDEPPWPVSRLERRYGLKPTESKSVFKIECILEDHPGFVEALAELAILGHRIVCLFGNHDRELQFEAIRNAFVGAIREAAEQSGETLRGEIVQFEPWFYMVPDELYVEHGNQYDQYSSFRYVLTPTVTDGDGEEVIAIPMGNLSARLMINVMGYFNPHAEDFVLSVPEYVAHWLRNYLFTRRSLMFAWLWGSILTLFGSLRTRKRVIAQGAEQHVQKRHERAEQTGLSRDTLRCLDDLRRAPVTDSLFRLWRELWLDRALIALMMTAATVVLALTAIPLWIKLMVPMSAFPLLYLAYEAFAQKSIFAYETGMIDRARSIAEETGCPLVSFGHSHKPGLFPLARGVSYVNSGAWAPTWDSETGESHPGSWNFIHLSVADDGSVDVQLDSWMGHTEAQAAELVEPLRVEIPRPEAAAL
jgi:UDP-2,3-diacylglucosamine pyrophosphatase LpxH